MTRLLVCGGREYEEPLPRLASQLPRFEATALRI